jgi:hypothetical protein
MRPKRRRTAAKLDDDFVELGSDELAELIEEEGPPSRKLRANNSRGSKKGPARSAVEPADAAADDEDYVPDDSEAAASGLAGEAAAARDSARGDATAAAAAAAGGGLSDSQGGNNSSSSSDEYHSAESDVDTDGSDADYDEDDSSSKPKPKGKKQQGASKAKAKQQKEKPPKKKRKSNRRLCATYAKAQFGLSDKDLSQLTDVEYKPNPYYKCRWQRVQLAVAHSNPPCQFVLLGGKVQLGPPPFPLRTYATAPRPPC